MNIDSRNFMQLSIIVASFEYMSRILDAIIVDFASFQRIRGDIWSRYRSEKRIIFGIDSGSEREASEDSRGEYKEDMWDERREVVKLVEI